MPKVLNKRTCTPEEARDAVYIGRPTVWGNPYEIGRDGTRQEVIEKYRRRVEARPDLKELIRSKLKGKDLVCFCTPKACHGDVLLKIANSED
jgi:hypothetical protein